MRVLFVCVKNTSRSQMAEALMKMALPEVEVHSAGIHPGEKVNLRRRNPAIVDELATLLQKWTEDVKKW